MKRIVETSASTRTLNLGDDGSMVQILPEQSQPLPQPIVAPIPVEIPPKHLFNSNLKDLQGFRDMRKNLKIKNSLYEFISETAKILDLFSSKDRKYDAKLVQFVCEMAENFFVSHIKMGAIKEEAVIEVVKKFYNNDVELVKSIIQLVLPFVKKTNALRRLKFRVTRFFLVIMTLFCHKD